MFSKVGPHSALGAQTASTSMPMRTSATSHSWIKAKKGIDYQYDPILLIGEFKVEKEMDDDYCVAIYKMSVDKVKVIDIDQLR